MRRSIASTLIAALLLSACADDSDPSHNAVVYEGKVAGGAGTQLFLEDPGGGRYPSEARTSD